MIENPEDPDGLHVVAGQTLWNLLGMLTPLLVALVAFPLLQDHLGKDRFGVLGIVGMLIGYLSIFDLGIGQAQSYLIADCRGRGETHRIPVVFQTALTLILLAGFLLGVGLFLGADWLSVHGFKIPVELQPEVRAALRVAAFAIPFAVLAPCLIATMEAFQDFKLINLIRIPTSASYFLLPLLVIPFTHSLPAVIVAMIAGRVLETVAFLFCCLRQIPGAVRGWTFEKESCVRMLRFGGWMTTTNIVLPLMIHGNIFILGHFAGTTAVAYYYLASEIIVRILVFPRALVTVLFPNLTIRFAAKTDGAEILMVQCLRLLLGLLVAISAGLVCLGPWALGLWMGGDFRIQSGPILRYLAVGILFLGLAYVPQYVIQASGRPRYTAWLHLVELPLFLLLAFLGVSWGDAPGIAVAWALRCTLDFFLMMALASRCLPALRGELGGLMLRVSLSGVMLVVLTCLPNLEGIPWASGAALVPLLALVWFWVLGATERNMVIHPLLKVLKRA